MKQTTNYINDLLVQGTRWGPEKLSSIKNSEKKYADKLFNALKFKEADEVIALCDKTGAFNINGNIGQVNRVYLEKEELKFKKYVKKYSPTLNGETILPVGGIYQYQM